MKYLKAFLIAMFTVFTFGSAMAQIVVHARVGGHYHHRHHHWHHHYDRR